MHTRARHAEMRTRTCTDATNPPALKILITAAPLNGAGTLLNRSLAISRFNDRRPTENNCPQAIAAAEASAVPAGPYELGKIQHPHSVI